MDFRQVKQWRKPWRAGTSTLDRNIWNLYIEIAYFGFQFGILQTFLNVYAIRLGASNLMLGLVSAMPAFIFAVGAIPAARLVERAARRMRFILITGSLHRLGVAALALMPFVFTSYRAEAVVVIVTLMSIPQIMANIAFSSMFAEVVPPERRAHVVAVRNTLLGLTSTLASFLGGLFLGLLPGSGAFDLVFSFPINYQILFMLGFIASMMGVVYMSRLRVSDAPPRLLPVAAVQKRGLLERLGAFSRLMRGKREFSRYALAMFIFHWGLFLPVPLYSLYWVRTLHASDSFIGIMLTVQSITTMVIYPFLPRMAARFGNRWLVATSALLVSIYPLATAFTTTLEPLLLISLIGGAGGAMFGLGSFNLLLEVIPQERRPSFIATFNSATFSAGFIAPFVGTGLLNFMDISTGLLIGAALRFIGAIAFIVLVGLSSKPTEG